VHRGIGLKIIATYFVIFITLILIFGFFWKKDDLAPRQPINFNHQLHIQKVGLECTHCHKLVEVSQFAGIPPLETCMTCHKAVATDRPEIVKLTRYWEEKKPIPWIRVYNLPVRKYVYFSHKRHIKAGFECLNCHGEVKVMPVMKRVRQLEMGWCMSCHRENNGPVDCTTCHK
jgi:hypothetical protein